jgi:hypothetical protein
VLRTRKSASSTPYLSERMHSSYPFIRPRSQHAMLFGLSLLAGGPSSACAQDPAARPGKQRYVLWFTPSMASHIHGVSIGPIGSEHLCSRSAPQVSNGVNAQFIGVGFFLLIGPGELGSGRQFEQLRTDTTGVMLDSLLAAAGNTFAVTHNGIQVSPLGTFTPRINGVSVSLISSRHEQLNGIAVNPLWTHVLDQRGISIGALNTALRTRGLQVGIFNRTHELRGLQFGLWNRNGKRALPIVNWGTGKL